MPSTLGVKISGSGSSARKIPERSAQRILKAADQILKVGTDQGVRP